MNILNQFGNSLQDALIQQRTRRQFKELLKYIRKKAPSDSPNKISIELNNFVDQIITDVNERIRMKKLESLPIPQWEDQFTKKFLGLTLRGTYRATNGRISNIATITRQDPCILAGMKSKLRNFSFTLSLKTAKIEFDNYELHCGPINTRGKISIEARENAFKVQINIKMNDKCKIETINMTRAEVTKCGNFKISVTGFGNLGGNKVAKMVINMLLNKYKDEMKTQFERDLQNNIKNTISKFL